MHCGLICLPTRLKLVCGHCFLSSLQWKCSLNVNNKHQSFALKMVTYVYHCSSPCRMSPPFLRHPIVKEIKSLLVTVFSDALIDSDELRLLWIKCHDMNRSQIKSQGNKLLSTFFIVLRWQDFYLLSILAITFVLCCICKALKKTGKWLCKSPCFIFNLHDGWKNSAAVLIL